MIIGVPIFAVIYDVFKKLMHYCLHRRGESEAITDYESEFPNVESKPSMIERIKKVRGKLQLPTTAKTEELSESFEEYEKTEVSEEAEETLEQVNFFEE